MILDPGSTPGWSTNLLTPPLTSPSQAVNLVVMDREQIILDFIELLKAQELDFDRYEILSQLPVCFYCGAMVMNCNCTNDE